MISTRPGRRIRSNIETGRDKRPFLPLDVELELMCNDFFSIWADARWCHYDNHLLSRNVELRWQDERGGPFSH